LSPVDANDLIHATWVEQPPIIDGQLDDTVWQTAHSYTEFFTFMPDWGSSLSEATAVQCAYDAHTLYFAFRCYDSRPDEIVASLRKWDDIFSEDYIGVLIDSEGDQQGAYGLMVTPLGVQGDIYMDANGNGDTSPDYLWDAAAELTGDGYTVELAVPLKSLRYTLGDDVTMGVGFWRKISRTSEQGAVPRIEPDQGTLLEQVGIVHYQDLKYDRIMELLPGFTYSRQHDHEQGSFNLNTNSPSLGLTCKMGVTPTLTLDATVNPDFSQVEADAGQVDVNLRSDLFYPEKRPFFMEGQQHLKFAGFWEMSGISSVLHTRNIVEPFGGLKLSGNLGKNNAVAGLVAADRHSETANLDSSILFSAGRFRHFLKSDSYLGGIFSSWDYFSNYNRIVGLDTRYWLTNTLLVQANAIGSWTDSTNGTPGTSTDVQMMYGDEFNSLILHFNDISRDFVLESGYVTRDGMRSLGWWASRNFFPEPEWLQKVQPGFWGFLRHDKYDDLDEYVALGNIRFYLPRTTEIRFDIARGTEVYSGEIWDVSFRRFMINSQPSSGTTLILQFRKGGNPNYDEDDLFQGDETRLTLQSTLTPSDRFSTTLDLTHQEFNRRSDETREWRYQLYRSTINYQPSKVLLFRTILEYNAYRDRLTTDLLASFNYFPGTVVHLGYGSIYRKWAWDAPVNDYVDNSEFIETNRSLFLKVSYNYRF